MQPTSIYLRCQYFETKFHVKLRKILQFSKMHIPLTKFCFENQWQIIVFLRHPVAYPVASEVEVEPNYSQEYQVSQKLIAASKAASEAVTAAALTTFQIPI